MVTWKPVRLTAMHHQHLALGATMVEEDGWQRPARYTSADEELQRLKGSVGLLDISPLAKLSIQGDEAESLLTNVFPGLPSLRVGEVSRQNPATRPESDPVLLARLARDEFLILTGPSHSVSLSEDLDGHPGGCAHVLDLSSGLAGARVSGPSAHLLLAAVTEFDVSPSAFPDMSCAQAKTAEIHCIIFRSDLAGLASYELFFGREFGEYMWEALLEAAEEHGGGPVGLEAMARLQR